MSDSITIAWHAIRCESSNRFFENDLQNCRQYEFATIQFFRLSPSPFIFFLYLFLSLPLSPSLSFISCTESRLIDIDVIETNQEYRGNECVNDFAMMFSMIEEMNHFSRPLKCCAEEFYGSLKDTLRTSYWLRWFVSDATIIDSMKKKFTCYQNKINLDTNYYN